MSMVAERARVGHGPAGPDPDGWCQRIALLEDENAALRDREQQLERERQQLGERIERLEAERERLAAEGERLQEVNARLRGEVEALRRAAKRQAAPFSRGDPKPDPKRAGRKAGAAHGRHAHRQPPQQVDRVVAVGLPDGCPGCGGELVLEGVAAQYVEELPQPRPLRIRYDLHIGRCRRCGRRVQPRHPAQTSDALGAAGTQLGPRAVALAAWLSKGLGVPAGKIAKLLAQLGVAVTAGGVVQAVARAARRAQPTYRALVGGVRRILLGALALRDAHHAGAVEQAALVAEADRLAAQLDKLVAGATRYPPNRRLLNHLAAEREHLFTFLRLPGVQATNWRAEQAIRPAVVTRKSWGGNRTWAGADTWQALTSVVRTATQQARDPVELLTCLLRAPTPVVADLTIPGR